MSNIGLGGP